MNRYLKNIHFSVKQNDFLKEFTFTSLDKRTLLNNYRKVYNGYIGHCVTNGKEYDFRYMQPVTICRELQKIFQSPILYAVVHKIDTYRTDGWRFEKFHIPSKLTIHFENEQKIDLQVQYYS